MLSDHVTSSSNLSGSSSSSQGSVLRPLLLIIYTSPLGEFLKSLGIHYQLYIDDIQCYRTFNVEDDPEAAKNIEDVVSHIRS